MQPRTFVHSLLRVGLVSMLLLSSGGRLLAQDVDGQPVDSAETAAVPMGAEFSEESAAGSEMEADAAETDEVLEADRGDTTTAGPAAVEEAGEFDAIDNAELGDDSTMGGPEVGENGEMAAPFSGEHLLFIPSIMTAGASESADIATDMAAEMSAVMDPATAEMDAALDTAMDTAIDAAMSTAAGGGSMQVASSQSVMGDFNGDGRSDLVVGVPYEDLVVAGVNLANAGAINVIYGSAGGLTAGGNQVWTQDSAGIAEVVEAGDLFGWSLAAGDFNGDNFDDLAVSAPYEDRGALANFGAVHIIYGTVVGLAAGGSQFWTQDTAGVLEVSEASDLFGLALTTGDFNRDGRDDLAIGVPYEDIGAIPNGGLVQVLYGAAGGLAAAGNQVWNQNSAGMLDVVEANDLFGRTLAAGDFDVNGRADLAIGVAYEDVGALANAGAVQIIRGTPLGLAAAGNQFITENSAGILGISEANDYYGWSLANGDYNGNGIADLAIGVPYEDYGALTNAGTVNVIYGTAGAGLAPAGNQVWSQNTAGILEVSENGDLFGYSLSAARFNVGVPSDLAIGVPTEDTAGLANTGAVNVLYGSAAGLNAAGNQFWTQNSGGVFDVAEAGDEFGLSLAVGDFNGNALHDLVVGVPYEDLGGIANMGAVNVIYGPLGGGGNQFWSQDTAGILGVGEANDYFGYTNQ